MRKGLYEKIKIQFDVGNEILLDDMGVAVAKKYLDKEKIDVPVDQNGEMMVNFFGDPSSYKMISFVDVVNKNFDPGTFKDKIVLIGATSFKEIHDEVLTPRSNVQPMSGVEFWANEIQTILDGKFLHNQSKFSQVITIACISTGLAIILSYFGVILSILVTLITIVVYFCCVLLLQRGPDRKHGLSIYRYRPHLSRFPGYTNISSLIVKSVR